MDLALAAQLPLLLGLAWLTPLASFVLILFFGPRMGSHGRNAAWVATAAIASITHAQGTNPSIARWMAGPKPCGAVSERIRTTSPVWNATGTQITNPPRAMRRADRGMIGQFTNTGSS